MTGPTPTPGAVARWTARHIEAQPQLRLLREPTLSVVLFERIGWAPADYDRWASALLDEQVDVRVVTWSNQVPMGRSMTSFSVWMTCSIGRSPAAGWCGHCSSHPSLSHPLRRR